MNARRMGYARRCGLAVGAVALLVAGCSFLSQSKQVVELIALGESRDLRKGKAPRTALTERRSDLLIIGIDGVDRALLYDMLRRGELPGLASLLGGMRGHAFPHAAFDERVLAVLPSSTIPGWASLFTGEPPAMHGLANNEVFIRDREVLAAPAPVSFKDATPALQCYTDDYADDLLDVPTIYEQMRADDPGVKIWVSMSQFHRGADRLLMARRTVFARKDSEVPFILAHRRMSGRQLSTIARQTLGDAPTLDDVGRLLVKLRLRERP